MDFQWLRPVGFMEEDLLLLGPAVKCSGWGGAGYSGLPSAPLSQNSVGFVTGPTQVHQPKSH